MKQILTILLLVFTLTAFGQENQTYDLKWEIGENEKLSYLTVMNDIDISSLEINIGGLFNSLSDSSKSGFKESKNFFKKLNDAFKNQDFVTTLTNKNNGVIDIVVTTKPKELDIDTTESKEEEVLKMMQLMTQGVMLRGSVYETGGIHSFWVKSDQKNLIALFFELPTKPVKVGDKWPLEINFITNDQNFDCDSSYKVNEVTLVDVKKMDGETIAFLKYNIIEYVKGNFNSFLPFDSDGGQQETMMKFNYQGIAEFSVDNGRWVNYDGILSLEAKGVIKANTKTKLTLIDVKNASR